MRAPLEYDSPAEAIAALFIEKLAFKLGLSYQEQAQVGGRADEDEEDWAWHQWVHDLDYWEASRVMEEHEKAQSGECAEEQSCVHGYYWSYTPYKADFLLNGNIAIEIDGSVHESSKQKAHDTQRDKFFNDEGIVTLRYPARLLFYREQEWKALLQTEIEGLYRTMPALFTKLCSS